MVLSKIRVLQNFCEISRVSQSRFLRGYQCLRVSNFCKVVSDYRSQSRILKGKKVSGSQRKTPVSPSHFYHSLPLTEEVDPSPILTQSQEIPDLSSMKSVEQFDK